MDGHEIIEVLSRLKTNASLSMYSHFGASERYGKISCLVGIPIIILNVFLGSVFAALLGEELPDIWKWVSAIVALFSAFLASILTFFRPTEYLAGHRRLANRFLEIKRQVELLGAKYQCGIIDLKVLALELEKMNESYAIICKDTEKYPTNDRDFKRAITKLQLEIENSHSSD